MTTLSNNPDKQQQQESSEQHQQESRVEIPIEIEQQKEHQLVTMNALCLQLEDPNSSPTHSRSSMARSSFDHREMNDMNEDESEEEQNLVRASASRHANYYDEINASSGGPKKVGPAKLKSALSALLSRVVFHGKLVSRRFNEWANKMPKMYIVMIMFLLLASALVLGEHLSTTTNHNQRHSLKELITINNNTNTNTNTNQHEQQQNSNFNTNVNDNQQLSAPILSPDVQTRRLAQSNGKISIAKPLRIVKSRLRSARAEPSPATLRNARHELIQQLNSMQQATPPANYETVEGEHGASEPSNLRASPAITLDQLDYTYSGADEPAAASTEEQQGQSNEQHEPQQDQPGAELGASDSNDAASATFEPALEDAAAAESAAESAGGGHSGFIDKLHDINQDQQQQQHNQQMSKQHKLQKGNGAIDMSPHSISHSRERQRAHQLHNRRHYPDLNHPDAPSLYHGPEFDKHNPAQKAIRQLLRRKQLNQELIANYPTMKALGNNVEKQQQQLVTNSKYFKQDENHDEPALVSMAGLEEIFKSLNMTYDERGIGRLEHVGVGAHQLGATQANADDPNAMPGAPANDSHPIQSDRFSQPFQVPQVECRRTPDGFEQFACYLPDKDGNRWCLEDRYFCDGYYDCPYGEDEDPRTCMFYKLHIEAQREYCQGNLCPVQATNCEWANDLTVRKLAPDVNTGADIAQVS